MMHISTPINFFVVYIKFIVKENDTRKRKLIESVLIQSTNNFNINQTNLNTDKFTNIILNNFSSRIKKNST